MLQATNISKKINSRYILDSCSVSLRPGRFTAVVGPNGAGKTSLLKVLSGEDKNHNGQVLINGKDVRKIKTKELSRQRAILPQQTIINFPFTIEQVIEIGRYPHTASAENNRAAIEEAIHITGLEPYRNRMYQTLSGGEKQRVQMARVISQISFETDQSRYLLLDEPTSSLDLAQQHSLLSLARDLSHQNIGVMAVLHDLNLALHYADDILLLKNGKTIAYGPKDEVISAEVIEKTFEHPVRIIRDQGQTLIVACPCATRKTAPCELKNGGREKNNRHSHLQHSDHENSTIRI